MNPKDLLYLVVSPACQLISLNTAAALSLLMGTMAQETNCGKRLIQSTYEYNGVETFKGGFGIYQMELITFNDVVRNCINTQPALKNRIIVECGGLDFKKLIYNLYFATIMTRLHYWRFPEPLPKYNDIEGLAKYWKRYYNSSLGAGTTEQFVDNYKKYVAPIWND